MNIRIQLIIQNFIFFFLKDDFEVEDAPQLLDLISNVVSVEKFEAEAIIVLTDRSKILATAARVTLLLLEHPDDAVSTADLMKKFEQTFGIKVLQREIKKK